MMTSSRPFITSVRGMKKYEIQMFIELEDYFQGPLSWHSGISNFDNGYGYDILLIYT